MNCHIVPQVYLKEWKIKEFKKSIYVFNKNQFGETGVVKNIRNLSDTSFAEEDEYILNFLEDGNTFALREDYEKVFF